MSSDKIYKHYY